MQDNMDSKTMPNAKHRNYNVRKKTDVQGAAKK